MKHRRLQSLWLAACLAGCAESVAPRTDAAADATPPTTDAECAAWQLASATGECDGPEGCWSFVRVFDGLRHVGDRRCSCVAARWQCVGPDPYRTDRALAPGCPERIAPGGGCTSEGQRCVAAWTWQGCGYPDGWFECACERGAWTCGLPWCSPADGGR